MTKKHQTVQELLKQHPAAVKVFIRYNTQCVGCAFERFCTLEDVAEHYKIPHPELKQTIQSYIHDASQQEK